MDKSLAFFHDLMVSLGLLVAFFMPLWWLDFGLEAA